MGTVRVVPTPRPAPKVTLTRPVVEPGGRITAIVGVTGVVDEVDDIIVPGAFVKSLQRRKPKGVKAHDWKLDVARVPYAEEWMPGDPRLPKMGPDGKAWPREAGALVMTFEYNLDVQRAADEYKMTRFYAETGEACFSIGYKVAAGKASKRADGVRMIYELELFEGSSVLFGAHPLTMALDVKDAAGDGFERKYTTGWWGEKTAEPNAGKGAMIALYPDPEVAKQLAHPDGSDPADLHITLAYLPDNEHSPDELAGMVAPAAAACGPLDGQVGGLGQFPPGDNGTPTFVPVDVPNVHVLHEAVKSLLTTGGAKVADQHGFTPHMTLGYDLDDASPAPATKVRFDRMHAVVGDQKTEIPFTGGKRARVESKAARYAVAAALALEAKALPKTQKCAHCDAQATKRVLHAEGMAYVPTCDKHLGKTKNEIGASDVSGVRDIPPVEGKAGNADGLKDWYTHGGGAAEIAWGTPGDFDRCVAVAGKHMTEEQAKGFCNLRHHDATGMYPATHAKLDRGKSASGTSAKAVVAAALSMKTTETKTMPYMIGSFEALQDQLRDAARDLLFPPAERGADAPAPWVCLTATYPDHIVVDASGLDSDGESYSIPYTVDPSGQVSLGTPQAVDVIAVVVPERDAAEDAAEAGTDAAEKARHVDPTVAALTEATARVALSPLGGKALEAGVRDALLGLLDELAVKGADVTGMVMGDDNTDDDEDLDRMRRRDDVDPLADDEDATPGKGLPPRAPAGSVEDDETDTDPDEDPADVPDVPPGADAEASDPEDQADGGDDEDTEDESDDGTVKMDPDELKKQLASLR